MRSRALVDYCRKILAFLVAPLFACALADANAARPNILFITVDDMNCDSMGVYGCELPGTTPNMDRLAAEGLRFDYAHVVVGNCMPSRNCMYSGLYPHNNRVEGFYQVPDKNYPVLCDLMKEGGYFTAIRGKVSHSTPYAPYPWDLVLDNVDGRRAHPKNAQSYNESTREGIAAAKKAGKPFCLVINISDPHKPFYATGKGGQTVPDANKPSRIFTADEVPVPGFLFDDPVVKKELAQYYSTVRRADDCLGATLQALHESGAQDNTVVMFLSDHGMPLPFAKTAVYHHSTRTPWIVRWPGVTQPNSIDKRHMISGVDVLPTLLDIAGIPAPGRQDGRSFAPIVRGGAQADRDFIIKEYNENAGGGRHPMRSVQTKRYCYIFNPWSNGERVFKTATTGTMTYRRMRELAADDKAIAARLDLFDHRVVEEFYDVENDPDSLHNLIDDPGKRNEIHRHRKILEAWMLKTGDHALEVFQKRDNKAFLEAYMVRIEKESQERRALKRRAAGPTKGKASARPDVKRGRAKLIALRLPGSATAGESVTVIVPHTLGAALGEQLVHVTLKDGNLKRLDRKVVKAKGAGELKVTFDLPATVPGAAISFAAFIGEDYKKNLQHIAAGPVKLK